jgi:DNA-binding transcriptional regulator YiaG
LLQNVNVELSYLIKLYSLQDMAEERLNAYTRHRFGFGFRETRFSARSVKAQRQRAGLSAADYAKLIGVSSLTIYNWEHNKSRPRKEQFASLIALRGLGKREAQAKLALLTTGKKKPAPKRRRPRGKK